MRRRRRAPGEAWWVENRGSCLAYARPLANVPGGGRMPPPNIARGTCYVLFAYDVAHAIDLVAAERRLARAAQRQTVKEKRRAPAFFEYDPAPLRVTLPAEALAVGDRATAPYVELVLYDFGAVSASYAIP